MKFIVAKFVKMEQLAENLLFADRYRLLEVKGRGSFGEVWRATDERLQSEVAVKVYIALDSKGLEEFVSEYKVANALSHPNLLHADYFDVWTNRPFIVMPYCPESSASLVGKMDEKTAWRFLRDVSGGLAYLHGKGIIHRDIKPDNILRDKEGRFLISDFGISTKMRSTLRRNSTREMSQKDIAGTIGYMAPELFSKKPESVKATDIWAMGASLYELLSGELPFMGQGGVMQLHGAETPELEGTYSRDLQGVLESCLAKDTWERPTAGQLQSYAEAKLRGETPARPWKSGGFSEKREGQNETLKPKQEEAGKPKGNQTVAISPGNVGNPKKAETGSGTREEGRKKKSGWIWGVALLVVFAAGILIWQNKQNQERQEEQERIALAEAQRKAREAEARRNAKIIRVGDVEFEMVYVEGGTFMMGATSEQGSDADADERPVHSVTLSSFYIGKYEVTQGLWREVMGSNPSDNKAGDDYPVEYVSWEDCQEFIRKLNDRTGLTFRLPTEAEWEYAARGGKKSRGYKYAGSDNLDEVGWYNENSGNRTHPVGSKYPNELGLYDMSGNVCELCQDWYGDYTAEAQRNPTGPVSKLCRVLRGGSGLVNAGFCRVSNRIDFFPISWYVDSGLRLALSI